jgi:hypothetical protein
MSTRTVAVNFTANTAPYVTGVAWCYCCDGRVGCVGGWCDGGYCRCWGRLALLWPHGSLVLPVW